MLARPAVQRLFQCALQDLHNTVCVCVVVDWAALAWVPHQDQEVGFAVAIVDQVAGVGTAGISESESRPIGLARSVGNHGILEVLNVDTGTIDSIARTEDLVDFGHEMGELVRGFR